ncbi:MAG: hypothetical protein J3R72DRAFT_252412 [Linnemannia gamsii]|nr:MAG: hypothetical protein J3R72DRAFT_252412 [Linnemannia gamsii]
MCMRKEQEKCHAVDCHFLSLFSLLKYKASDTQYCTHTVRRVFSPSLPLPLSLSSRFCFFSLFLNIKTLLPPNLFFFLFSFCFPLCASNTQPSPFSLLLFSSSSLLSLSIDLSPSFHRPSFLPFLCPSDSFFFFLYKKVFNYTQRSKKVESPSLPSFADIVLLHFNVQTIFTLLDSNPRNTNSNSVSFYFPFLSFPSITHSFTHHQPPSPPPPPTLTQPHLPSISRQ